MGKRVVIMGAAGRDFHNFNVVYRGDPEVEVVAFTATQIPGIEGRRYPPALAGPGYPDGIPILTEDELPAIIRDRSVDEVVFAYSDVSHEYVMHRASIALAAGAGFTFLGPGATMLARCITYSCETSEYAKTTSSTDRSRTTAGSSSSVRMGMPSG